MVGASEDAGAQARHQGIGVLSALQSDEVATIRFRAPLRRFHPGESIALRADGEVALVLVEEGRFLFTRVTKQGRRLVTVAVYPDSAFLHLPAANGDHMELEGEAQEESAARLLSVTDLKQVVLALPHFAWNLLHIEAEYARVLEEKFELQAFSPLATRLAALLLRLASRGRTEIRISHGRLAEGVGASREAVTRTLDTFQADGLLSLSRTSVLIRDEAGLRALAEGDI